MIKNCHQCNLMFNDKGQGRQIYCSRKCSGMAATGKELISRIDNICEICGLIFKTIPSRTNKTCSTKCKNKLIAQSQDGGIFKTCDLCFAKFKTKQSHLERRKYCSKKCMDAARVTHELRNCIICATEFKFYKSQKGAIGKYCSLQCKGKGLTLPRIKKLCLVCEKEFIPSIGYKKKKYCSIECYATTMDGIEKPSFWETATKEEQLARLKQSYEKYVIRNDEGCWGWKGCLAKKYGSLQYGGKYKSISAHRASYLIHHGDIPNRLFVCHKCDNPPCTRPDHLFLGTSTDNNRDMFAKGRAKISKGEASSSAKLNNEKVIKIRERLQEGRTMQSLSDEYNVAIETIFDIKHNKTWKHLS